jgi:hypothetical protein
MSKTSGIWRITLVWSAALDWCKKTASRYQRFAGRRSVQFKVGRATNVSHPLRVDFCGERIELKEFIKVLRIGDRIRVLCDDGVVVAEKISQTQFKLIHSQTVSELVH